MFHICLSFVRLSVRIGQARELVDSHGTLGLDANGSLDLSQVGPALFAQVEHFEKCTRLAPGTRLDGTSSQPRTDAFE